MAATKSKLQSESVTWRARCKDCSFVGSPCATKAAAVREAVDHQARHPNEVHRVYVVATEERVTHYSIG